MSLTQQLSVGVGVVILGVLWMGPLPDLTTHSFSAHMTLHMGVVAVAAPLLAAGLAGSRVDPARTDGLASPILASVVELVVVWGWHTPALHEAARASAGMFIAEQMSFLAVGFWLWATAIGGRHSEQFHRRWAGVFAVVFTSVHMTLLGSLFSFATRVLYDGHPSTTHTLADQHLGGGIMLLIGGVSYLAGGLLLARDGLRPTPRVRERVS